MAAELANIERIMPFLLQIPGINPAWLAKELLKRLDDKLDMSAAIAEGLESVVSMNQMQRLEQAIQRVTRATTRRR